jgi:hypothetical protein
MGKGLAALIALLGAFSSASHAINWEGHETFFHEAVPLPELTEGVPPAKPDAMPTCEVRRRAAEKNPYEQEAIAGVNCIETQPTKK